MRQPERREQVKILVHFESRRKAWIDSDGRVALGREVVEAQARRDLQAARVDHHVGARTRGQIRTRREQPGFARLRRPEIAEIYLDVVVLEEYVRAEAQ